MSDITGPISSLPGSVHRLPKGAMCDVHPDRLAVKRIQGETDSMGCELWDCCQECLDDMKKESPRIGQCDWCKANNVETKPTRDYDEGLTGRVYDVCKPCIDRRDQRAIEEVEQYPFYDPDTDD